MVQTIVHFVHVCIMALAVFAAASRGREFIHNVCIRDENETPRKGNKAKKEKRS